MTRKFGRRAVVAGIGTSLVALASGACGRVDAAARRYRVTHTDAEWRKLLTPQQYSVLRDEGTERPFSSPLLREHRRGTFACAADGNPLFASRTKFESGTGWPSFFAPLAGGVGTATDFKLGYPRTAVHCLACGGHLGHVFDDGPPPTGKRYCMNGAAMRFTPA